MALMTPAACMPACWPDLHAASQPPIGESRTPCVLLQTLAMQKVMSKFGIIEVARTGRICLKRGEELLEGRDLEGRVRRMRGS
jgi:hypothetical protein